MHFNAKTIKPNFFQLVQKISKACLILVQLCLASISTYKKILGAISYLHFLFIFFTGLFISFFQPCDEWHCLLVDFLRHFFFHIFFRWSLICPFNQGLLFNDVSIIKLLEDVQHLRHQLITVHVTNQLFKTTKQVLLSLCVGIRELQNANGLSVIAIEVLHEGFFLHLNINSLKYFNGKKTFHLG